MIEANTTKRSWLWILVLAASVLVFVVAVAAMLFREGDSEEKSRPRARVKQSSMTQREIQARLEKIRNAETPDPAEEARATIEEHRERIENEPDAAERPALLQAMGNLYRHKLLDYENAAWCYEQIILNYPDWAGTSMVYGDLATCYEKMDDPQNAMRIYMEMMRVLPEDSQEYLYAKDKLKL